MTFISAIYIPKHNYWCMTRGEYSTKKFSSPEGRWRTIRKPELEKNIKIPKYIHLHYIYNKKEQHSIGGYSSWILIFVILGNIYSLILACNSTGCRWGSSSIVLHNKEPHFTSNPLSVILTLEILLTTIKPV